MLLKQLRSMLVGWRGRLTGLRSRPQKGPQCASQVVDTVLGAGVPLAGVVGGGYHADLTTLARRHTCLHRAAARMWADHGLS